MAPPVVEFTYEELADGSADLSAKIEEVIGTPAGLPPPLPLLNRIAAAARPRHRSASPQCLPLLWECQAFGPDGLGICTVSGVPGFVEARQALLPLAAQLAALPDCAKAALEDPASRFNFGWGRLLGCVTCDAPAVFPSGAPAATTPPSRLTRPWPPGRCRWSCGQEVLEGGVPDTRKGRCVESDVCSACSWVPITIGITS